MSKAFNPLDGLINIGVIEEPCTNPKSNNLLYITVYNLKILLYLFYIRVNYLMYQFYNSYLYLPFTIVIMLLHIKNTFSKNSLLYCIIFCRKINVTIDNLF